MHDMAQIVRSNPNGIHVVNGENINSVRARLTAAGEFCLVRRGAHFEAEIGNWLKLHVDDDTEQVYLLVSYTFMSAHKTSQSDLQIAFNMIVQYKSSLQSCRP